MVVLLSLSSGLTLEIIQLPSLNSQILLQTPLALPLSNFFLRLLCLFSNLALKNFIFLFETFQLVLVRLLLVFAFFDLVGAKADYFFGGLVQVA